MRKPCSKNPLRDMVSGLITLARWSAWTPHSGTLSSSCSKSGLAMSMAISNATPLLVSGPMEKVLICGRAFFLLVNPRLVVEGNVEIQSRIFQSEHLFGDRKVLSPGVEVEYEFKRGPIIILMLLSGLFGSTLVSNSWRRISYISFLWVTSFSLAINQSTTICHTHTLFTACYTSSSFQQCTTN